MKAAAAVATLAATVSAHGGLTFPPSRNNYHNQDPTVRTGSKSFHNNGAFCTGDQCLWFNEGCVHSPAPAAASCVSLHFCVLAFLSISVFFFATSRLPHSGALLLEKSPST